MLTSSTYQVSIQRLKVNKYYYFFELDGLESFKFTMEGVLMTLVGIFGMLGNVLGLIILTRPQMRRLPINLILIGKV